VIAQNKIYFAMWVFTVPPKIIFELKKDVTIELL